MIASAGLDWATTHLADVAQRADSNASALETEAAIARQSAVRRSLDLITEGRRGFAQFVLTRSVEQQFKILTGQPTLLPPTCPCGGRCPHGLPHAVTASDGEAEAATVTASSGAS